MHLHILVFLLFTLLTGGFCLECYKCNDQQDVACKTTMRCDSEKSRCWSSRGASYMAGTKRVQISSRCIEPQKCKSKSMTTLYLRSVETVHCCDTDLCNEAQPEPNAQPNGKECFACDWEGCSQRVKCRGIEDHCFTAYDSSQSSVTMKGCASDAACEKSGNLLGHGQNVKCCEGNLCNAAQSVPQSFLFLCCSLIFYFLLH